MAKKAKKSVIDSRAISQRYMYLFAAILAVIAVSFIIAVNAAPSGNVGIPVTLFPPNAEYTPQNTKLKWTKVTEASEYQLRVSEASDSKFKNPILNVRSKPNTFELIDLDSGPYIWEVRTVVETDSGQDVSAWSPTSSFVIK